MGATRKHQLKKPCLIIVGLLLLCFGMGADATLVLDNHFASGFTADGRLIPDDQYEVGRFDKAVEQAAAQRNAVINNRLFTHDSGYIFFVNDIKYYYRGVTFMEKTSLNDMCDPDPSASDLAYRCVGGHRLVSQCHTIFLDSGFKEVGFHTVDIKVPFPYFCNSIPAVGVRDKMHDDLLMTVQYFNIDGSHATKADDIGSSWQRMTVLLHIKAVDGKIQVEQDDVCLGNPNNVDSIPNARKKLKSCETKAKR